MTNANGHPESLSGGNIILQCRTATPNLLALQSAVLLAKALRLNIKSVFLEDTDVLKLASLPFAAEISYTGRQVPIAGRTEMEQKMKIASAGLRQVLNRLAESAAVTCEFTTVRSAHLGAIVPHCSDQCIVVMADTFAHSDMLALSDLFARVEGLAGALLVGPRAQRREGPILVLGEPVSDQASLERIAEHLAFQEAVPNIISVAQAHQAASEINKRSPALVIAKRGQTLRPGDGALRSLVNQLQAPLLLLR